jgi:hypothetical protein
MEEVNKLHVSVASLKSDMDTLKKLVYLGAGAGVSTLTGIIIQFVAHSWK